MLTPDLRGTLAKLGKIANSGILAVSNLSYDAAEQAYCYRYGAYLETVVPTAHMWPLLELLSPPLRAVIRDGSQVDLQSIPGMRLRNQKTTDVFWTTPPDPASLGTPRALQHAIYMTEGHLRWDKITAVLSDQFAWAKRYRDWLRKTASETSPEDDEIEQRFAPTSFPWSLREYAVILEDTQAKRVRAYVRGAGGPPRGDWERREISFSAIMYETSPSYFFLPGQVAASIMYKPEHFFAREGLTPPVRVVALAWHDTTPATPKWRVIPRPDQASSEDYIGPAIQPDEHIMSLIRDGALSWVAERSEGGSYQGGWWRRNSE
jgi:hypothetical protein